MEETKKSKKKIPKKSIPEIAEIISKNIKLSSKEKEQALTTLERLYKATKVSSVDADAKIKEIEAVLERELTDKEKKVIQRKYSDEGHEYPSEYRRSIQFSSTCISHVIQLIRNL